MGWLDLLGSFSPEAAEAIDELQNGIQDITQTIRDDIFGAGEDLSGTVNDISQSVQGTKNADE
ncbi:MAG: hypothetical protein WAR37_02005 [Candidatus Microsaccharimonas sp.]